jgi:type I restriction enzyme S subunit
MNKRFCLYVFKSRLFRAFVEAGLNSGSLIQNIFTSQISCFAIPVPPLEEQEVIVQMCDAMFSGLEQLEREISRQRRGSVALRQSTLTAAFAGKLVPQDAADEPVSVLLDRIRVERTTALTAAKRRGRRPAKR